MRYNFRNVAPNVLLHKTSKFNRISWYGNFVQTHCFPWAIRPKLCENCTFPQGFHTRKPDEIMVFHAVFCINAAKNQFTLFPYSMEVCPEHLQTSKMQGFVSRNYYVFASLPEMYLGPYQGSMMEFFCRNSYCLLSSNF